MIQRKRFAWRLGLLALGAAALLSSGCYSTKDGRLRPRRSESVAQNAPPRKATGTCINMRAVSDFKPLDKRRVLLYSKPPKVVELFPSCDNVQYLEELKLSGVGADGLLCDDRNDAIVVRGQVCTIASIYDFDEDPEVRMRREIEGDSGGGKR